MPVVPASSVLPLPQVRVFEGAAEAQAVSDWMAGAAVPLVGELTQRSKRRYAALAKPVLRVALPGLAWADNPKGRRGAQRGSSADERAPSPWQQR